MKNMPVYQTILARRSIRNFLNKPVTNEQIDLMLKGAMAAPSACNLQPWAFIVVNDEEILKALKETTSQGAYNAPLAIVVCGITEHIPWQDEGWRQDCGGAVQNIMLIATELGLASVCIGGFDEEQLKRLLDIPEAVEPMCIIEIGYPSYQLPSLTWYTTEAVHYQKYDQTKKRKLRTIKMLEDEAKNGII